MLGGRVSAGVTTGAVVAFATFCVYDLLVVLRVNLFLAELTQRAGWQNLLSRFTASGCESLRTFLNVENVKGAPLKIGVASVIGAAMGADRRSVESTGERTTGRDYISPTPRQLPPSNADLDTGRSVEVSYDLATRRDQSGPGTRYASALVPFTIAHAAAAWPLRKAIPQLPLLPLIIGTLAPDFEFFVRLAPNGDALHSVGGLLAIGLPVSLLVWIVFRRVVRQALVDLMPRHLARAMRTESTTVLYASLAITAGGLSHIGWDYLSHHWTRWNLQDASTVLGIVVLAVWCSQWVRSSPAAHPRMRSSREWGRAMRAARTMFLLCSVGGVLSGLRPAVSTRVRVGQIAVGAMLGVVLALALITWKHRSKASALQFSPKTTVRH